MNSVLTKTIVMQFYKINTGFFLVSFILLFGLLNGKATMDLHHHIMQNICSSLSFAAGAAVVWSLYTVKCVTFFLKNIYAPANTFLFTMQSLSNRRQMFLLLQCQALLLSPVLAYAGVTIAVGLSNGNILLPALFATFQLALCGSAIIYYRAINSTWHQPAFRVPSVWANKRKPFITYLLHYSLNTRKSTFIGIKILSLLLLQGMVMANSYEVNKESICVLMMFLISAHALLPAYYVQFMENSMSFLRNMPITLGRKYMVYVVTYAVIFLPELLFLLLNSKHALPLQLICALYTIAITQLSLYTSLQYLPRLNTDRYTGIVFGFFFASLLFLASFNLWLLAIVETIAAIALFSTLYTKYEHS